MYQIRVQNAMQKKNCRVDFKSGIFVESKSGMGFVRSAFDFTLFELSDCC